MLQRPGLAGHSNAPKRWPRPLMDALASAQAQSLADASTFAAEKREIMEEIVASCAEAVEGMRSLNRNLDQLVEVGQELEAVSRAWSSFEALRTVASGPE